MEFKEICGYQGLENFNKLWADEKQLTLMAQIYAQEANLDKNRSIEMILEHDKNLKQHVLRRRKFKAFFKGSK